jgi:putative phage-type endonuclease
LENLIKHEIGDAVFIGDYESGSQEWLELRKQGIGGSDIGTIIGANPYESAYTLWHKRLGLIPESDLSDNLAVWLGNVLELPILTRFEQLHPELEIFRVGTYRNKKHEFMQANADALFRNKNTGEWGIIEVKTGRNPWDDVPPSYRAQVQWYLSVFGMSKAYIVGFVEYKWEERRIESDSFEAAHLVTEAKRFLNAVKTASKPDWDGSDSTLETTRMMNPNIDGTTIEVGEIGVSLWNAQMRYDEAKAELNAYKSAVLDCMGSARYATTTVDGEGTFTVASRISRKEGLPYLVVKK